jgi:hypothetical protein
VAGRNKHWKSSVSSILLKLILLRRSTRPVLYHKWGICIASFRGSKEALHLVMRSLL